jgi:hypothetical protein
LPAGIIFRSLFPISSGRPISRSHIFFGCSGEGPIRSTRATTAPVFEADSADLNEEEGDDEGGEGGPDGPGNETDGGGGGGGGTNGQKNKDHIGPDKTDHDETGRIGMYLLKFAIPNLNREDKRIPTSSVVLSSQLLDLRDSLYTARDKANAGGFNPLTYTGRLVIPSVTRVFSRSREMYVYLHGDPAAGGVRYFLPRPGESV